jgi:hypothetical protein
VLPPSIGLHHISLERNNQGTVNNADLYLRREAAKESQPMSSQEAINIDKERSINTKYAALMRSQTRGRRLIRRRLLEKKN